MKIYPGPSMKRTTALYDESCMPKGRIREWKIDWDDGGIKSMSSKGIIEDSHLQLSPEIILIWSMATWRPNFAIILLRSCRGLWWSLLTCGSAPASNRKTTACMTQALALWVGNTCISMCMQHPLQETWTKPRHKHARTFGYEATSHP